MLPFPHRDAPRNPVPHDVPRVKLLCAADLHLGRRPSSKVPPDLGVDARDLGPARAWERLVDDAVREGVDAVLMAGDLVDASDDVFEAYRALEAGAATLTAAGIPLYCVAGNHDGEVLPRLVDAVDGVTLLGRGGTWERATIEGADGDAVDVVGWSFPAEHHDGSPFDAPPPAPERRTIGLLHGDRDAAGGRYAPFAARDLERVPYDAWLLGHIHVPDPMDGPRPAGYLGSVVGTDPSEPGPRGAWLLRTDGGGVTLTHRPFAPLRWDRLDLDAAALDAATPDGGDPGAAFQDAVLRALADLEADLAASPHPPDVVGVELHLHGATRHGPALRAAAAPAELAKLARTSGRPRTFVHGVRDTLVPARDLAALAANDDPAGLLARHVLTLREGGEAAAALVRRARDSLERAQGAARFTRHLPPADPTDAELADLLERAAVRALEGLLAQRDGADGAPGGPPGGPPGDGDGR